MHDWRWFLFDAAALLGVVPIGVVAWHHHRSALDASAWWISAAFAVSFLVDAASRVSGHAPIARIYPIAQCSLVLVTILSREDAMTAIGVFSVIGLLALVNPLPNDDALLRVVTFGTVVGAVWQIPALGRLRSALLVYFGAGLSCWLAYVITPGWTTYLMYQSTRVFGIAIFCRAVSCNRPALRVLRRAA